LPRNIAPAVLTWAVGWPPVPVGGWCGLTRPDGSNARRRVFISHTSELRDFPKGGSYVAAVERAVSACGHVIVDMKDFPAADQAPAELCRRADSRPQARQPWAPEDLADLEEQRSPSIDRRLSVVESALAVAQEAIAAL